jgi:hypothetical protein
MSLFLVPAGDFSAGIAEKCINRNDWLGCKARNKDPGEYFKGDASRDNCYFFTTCQSIAHQVDDENRCLFVDEDDTFRWQLSLDISAGTLTCRNDSGGVKTIGGIPTGEKEYFPVCGLNSGKAICRLVATRPPTPGVKSARKM